LKTFVNEHLLLLKRKIQQINIYIYTSNSLLPGMTSSLTGVKKSSAAHFLDAFSVIEYKDYVM